MMSGGSLMQEYYTYAKSQLLNKPQIPIEVMNTSAAVFQAIADEMIAIIMEKAKRREPCLLICPVGPIGHYPYFVKRVNEERICLSHVWMVNMDEYLTQEKQWISLAHPLSFRGFMEREVYKKIKPELNVPAEQRFFPDPNRLSQIPEIIAHLGGVDAVFGGIGLNGHVAFNEPQPELSAGEFINLKTRICLIAAETRACNAMGDFYGRLEEMPQFCVTVGMKEIYGASKIRLAVFRPWHSAVLRRAAHGAYSSAFPVSLLQTHADTIIRIPQTIL